MIITWIGQSCFKIQDKVGPEGITLVTDPYDKSIGLKTPNFEANIITISHDHVGHNNAEALRGKPFVIDVPGEYDVQGILVQGIPSFHDDKVGIEKGENIIYRIEVDGITIAHLGDLGHSLSDEQLEQLEGVDVLLIPVGGVTTIDAKKAVEVVSQIEPRIVIPMHYKIKDLKENLDELDKFIKELGVNPINEDKLKMNKKDLPQEGMDLFVLSPSN